MRVALFTLAACGRIAFDPLGGGPPGSDAGDGGVTIDGAMDRANLVFVTNSSLDGAMGGLAGADARCDLEAMQAGKPGRFVAWLSSSTVNARDRLAGSRGWVLADGRPVADTVAQLLAGEIYNPIDETAPGTVSAGFSQVWTATDGTGALEPSGQCADWTDGTITKSAAYGASDHSWPQTTFYSSGTCNAAFRIYCFEIGHAFPVQPTPSGTRVAFLSDVVSELGVAGLDGECQLEATAAGLGGTYLAALATSTASTASRFPGSTVGWNRVDGTVVVPDAASMFSGNNLASWVHQTANGNYQTSALMKIRTGAPTPQMPGTNTSTCSDWTANTGQASTLGDASSTAGAFFWSGSTATCVTGERVVCLQM